MKNEHLLCISPIDGRYAKKTRDLQSITSEFGLIKYRVEAEIGWLLHMLKVGLITPTLPEDAQTAIKKIAASFDLNSALKVKTLERSTRHDVKAVEYHIQQSLEAQQLSALIPWVHFACTSEDINSTAYALMLKDAREVLTTHITGVISTLNELAATEASTAMLARTHGQTASPTTLGKELKVFAQRLQKELETLTLLPVAAKFSGAVGNYNAHVSAFPDADWPTVCATFIDSMGLAYNDTTTQIEPHDHLAAFMHNLMRINTILVDTCRDIWHYISLNYFSQKKREDEVGSSTMPHKINPIDFENAEGNLGVANALAQHLANKLPVSRLQRDLSDSTVLRNLGVVCAHSLLAYQSMQQGFSRLEVNHTAIQQDISACWEVLAEPIQTVLRKNGIGDAYEQLKSLTRGSHITAESIQQFIQECNLNEEDKQRLLKLTPETYIGLATDIARGKK